MVGVAGSLGVPQKSSKVAMVKKFPKAGKSKPQWAQYQYDDHGNLVFAKNSDGKGRPASI